MNTKQKLTLGIAAIFMVTLTIVGVTYAYFVTQVNGNTTQNVNVQTAKIGIEYVDGNGTVTLTDVLPGAVAYKAFQVKNSISTASVQYQIGISQTAGDTEFLHAPTASVANCYDVDEENDTDCYSSNVYNNVYVTLVEYTGGDAISASTTQAQLQTFFESTNKVEVGSTTNVASNSTSTAPQYLGTDTIDGITDSSTTVYKTYIMKVEYKAVDQNQNIENNAGLTLKVDLFLPSSE